MKTTTERYKEILQEQPILNKCFFAFSEKQFEEEKIKANIRDNEKILSANGGLFGTQEGLDEMIAFCQKKKTRIATECNPQDVYNYEWNNYECMITYDDEEAIKQVIFYFGTEGAKNIKRKYGYAKI